MQLSAPDVRLKTFRPAQLLPRNNTTPNFDFVLLCLFAQHTPCDTSDHPRADVRADTDDEQLCAEILIARL